MINHIASTRVYAADVSAVRESRTKKNEPAKDPSVETGETPKTARSAHSHDHVPPGLARAAEKIASKIFARADADASGTVTLQELSAVHSRHARTLASSDLFQAPTAETRTGDSTATNGETVDETTAGTPETPINVTTEPAPETPVQVGVTEAQLKEALIKSFYAKVGVVYTSPAQPTTGPAPTTSADATAPSVSQSVAEESDSNPSFTGVA